MTQTIRGFMLDAARLPEPLPYYRQVIDRCAEWGLNTILLRLADDQGSAVRFASHPELRTHAHAFTPTELRELAQYGAARGVDLIPELEAFGHTGFITGSPQHAHLRDDHPEGISHFTGIQPLHPESMTILQDLVRETAAIFPSPYLHLGCDEVNWGGSAYSRALIAARGHTAVWIDHLNQLNDFTRQAGKEMMVWADHVLVHEPDILTGLSRQVILVDWNYWDTQAETPAPGAHRRLSIAGAAERALQAGFRLVGAPALTWCRWNLRPGAMQLENINAFAKYYRALDHPANLGVIVTNWVPSRYLPAALWDGLAYAGMALADTQSGMFGQFARQHFGITDTDLWQNFYTRLYREIRPRFPCAGPELAPHQAVLWASLDDLRSLHSAPSTPPASQGLEALLTQANQLASLVQRNEQDFTALLLSLSLLAHIERRAGPAVVSAALHAAVGQSSGAQTGEQGRLAPGEQTLLAEVARKDAALLVDYTQEWDRLRFADCPSKGTLLPALSPADQPLLQLSKSSAFSSAFGGLP